MKLKKFWIGALVGAFLSAPLIALMFLADQVVGFGFIPFDIFNWISRLLPGPVITFGIDLMIDTLRFLGINVANTAKIAEQVMAVSLFLVLGVAAGVVFFLVLDQQKIKTNIITGMIMGALFGFPAIAITIAFGNASANPIIIALWLLILYLLWGIILVWIFGKLNRLEEAESAPSPTETEVKPAVEKLDRRKFLIWVGASAATITVVGSGLGSILATRESSQPEGEDKAAHEGEGPSGKPFPNSDAMVVPVPGTRPEYTPVKDHYKVFIELEPTVIDGSSWRLPITGLVDNPLMLTLDDLRNNYEPINQYITLSCISGRIGTSLISTTYWTGARVQDVLADAGVQEDARYLYITSGDGFYETVPLDIINSDSRIMFCYSWDGNTLPVDHGFPVRIWWPDRFGMKQPKWITGIEVTDTYKEGYWVERGWSEQAIVRTTSVIDTVAVDHMLEKEGRQYIPIGGIAFAGARGISKVEVRINGGAWQDAQLRQPLSETTWVIWRFEWRFEPGSHTFEVRCYDSNGELQVLETSPARPDGSTGIHSVEEQISGS